jgi:outer membrane receptor protein involved in Fe transport
VAGPAQGRAQHLGHFGHAERHADAQSETDLDHRLSSVDGVYSTGDGSPLNPSLQANNIYNKQFSQELRLSAKFGDLANLTVGGFYFYKRSRYQARIELTTLNFIEDDSIPATTKAVFANADISPIRNLTVIGGIRYTDQSKTFTMAALACRGRQPEARCRLHWRR